MDTSNNNAVHIRASKKRLHHSNVPSTRLRNWQAAAYQWRNQTQHEDCCTAVVTNFAAAHAMKAVSNSRCRLCHSALPVGSSGLKMSAYKPDARSENAATHSLRDRPLLLTAKCMALLPVNTTLKDRSSSGPADASDAFFAAPNGMMLLSCSQPKCISRFSKL